MMRVPTVLGEGDARFVRSQDRTRSRLTANPRRRGVSAPRKSSILLHGRAAGVCAPHEKRKRVARRRGQPQRLPQVFRSSRSLMLLGAGSGSLTACEESPHSYPCAAHLAQPIMGASSCPPPRCVKREYARRPCRSCRHPPGSSSSACADTGRSVTAPWRSRCRPTPATPPHRCWAPGRGHWWSAPR